MKSSHSHQILHFLSLVNNESRLLIHKKNDWSQQDDHPHPAVYVNVSKAVSNHMSEGEGGGGGGTHSRFARVTLFKWHYTTMDGL